MVRLRPYLLVAALAGLGVSIWAIFYGGGDAWLAHNLGLYNETGPWYAFWSGFGSDIGEYAVFGATSPRTVLPVSAISRKTPASAVLKISVKS